MDRQLDSLSGNAGSTPASLTISDDEKKIEKVIKKLDGIPDWEEAVRLLMSKIGCLGTPEFTIKFAKALTEALEKEAPSASG